MSIKENKINIGLDIGVASVGWSIIDDDCNIIDMGVRLFDDPATNGNADRRNARHLRRLYSRRKIRKNKLGEFLVKNHLVHDYDDFCQKINIDITKFNVNNPIELKCKALKQKVSNDELIYILFHYINHRGYFYLTIEEEKKLLNNNTNKSNDKDNIYPSEKLLEFYKKYGYYKGVSSFCGNDKSDKEDNDGSKDNKKLIFSNREWCEEIKQLLQKQDYDDEFINDYLEIFSKIRKFNEGPGGPKSPTPYGLYIIDHKDKEVRCIGKNLWDATIGNCSYFCDKKENQKLNIGDKDGKIIRGFKNSPISELFNLFNDISNIRFKTDPFKITVEIKNQIINDINKDFPKKIFKFTLKKIAKFHNKFCNNCHAESILCEDDINGYRTKGKNNTFDFTSLDNYTIIANYLYHNYDKLSSVNIDNGKDKNKKDVHSYKYEGDCSITNIKLLEKCNLFFIDIAKNTSDFLSRRKWLQETQKLIENKDPSENEKLAHQLKNLTKCSALSDKAMLKYIEYFISESQNNDTFYDNWTAFAHKNPPYGENYSSSKNKVPYLPSNLMDNEVVSPTVKKSFNQACQIVNKIINVYCKKNKNKPNKKIYKIDNIIVELPRDKNSDEEKKRIKKHQAENQSINDEAKLENISSECWKLYKLQDKKDLYDGKKINLKNDILEVDHIIPISISSDDSLANKVLTKHNNNSAKGQNTPYQWLSSQKGKYIEYMKRVNYWWNNIVKKEKKYQKKYDYLLYEKDPLNNINEFINRNLVDTRYASRLVLHKLQDFFKQNNDYGKAKIKVVRGSITSLCRNYLFYDKNKKTQILPKDRNLYCHHAIDASLICFLGMNSNIHKLIKNFDYFTKTNHFNKNENNQLINNLTGEVLDVMKLYDKNKEVMMFGKELAKYNDKIIIKNVEILNDNDKNDHTKQYEFIPAEKKVHFSRKLKSKNNIQLSNQTIYSLRYNQVNKTYQMITKIDLIDSKTKDLDKFFNPKNPKFDKCSKSLLIFNEDKKLYDMLQKIFIDFSTIKSDDFSGNNEHLTNDEKKVKLINPFIAYMDSQYKKIKTNCIIINKQRLRKLRYVWKSYRCKNEKDIDKIIPGVILKSHSNSKSYGIIESLNALSWRLYKDLYNKLVVIPINVKVLSWDNIKKHLTIKQSKLKEALKNKKIINENDYVELKRGSILRERSNPMNIFYVSGYNSKNFEIKPINYEYGYYQKKINCKKTCKQFFILPISLFKNYELVQIDVLGKIFKAPKEENFFKNYVK